jgi:hypothetical protein
MAPGRTVTIATRHESTEGSWSPVLLTTHGYYVAAKGGYDSHVFADKFQPIVSRAKLTAQFELSAPLAVGTFDYLLVQVLVKDLEVPPPSDGRLVVESGPWRLYARSDLQAER